MKKTISICWSFSRRHLTCQVRISAEEQLKLQEAKSVLNNKCLKTVSNTNKNKLCRENTMIFSFTFRIPSSSTFGEVLPHQSEVASSGLSFLPSSVSA